MLPLAALESLPALLTLASIVNGAVLGSAPRSWHPFAGILFAGLQLVYLKSIALQSR
jgi:hypothetical protein